MGPLAAEAYLYPRLMQRDVPSPIDLRNIADARRWEASALAKRPWRLEFFNLIAADLSGRVPSGGRILELGSGPGFLAQHLLESLPGISCVLLDYSLAMHELARSRLGTSAVRATFVQRNFKESEWYLGLGRFDAVVTNQAVHELRHKQHAETLHARVHRLLLKGGPYLVCDHFAGPEGMSNDELYMSVEEQRAALLAAGFSEVDEMHRTGGMVLHRAIST